MRLTSFRETEEYRRGHSGERKVADLLRKMGYYVIPSYDYTGEEDNKAPLLQGSVDAFILPDLDVSKLGKRKWVEVKTKTVATFTRTTNRLEHGIPQRHWDAYERVEEITGCPVALAIYEIETGKVLMATLSSLRKAGLRVSEMKKAGLPQGKMVYFARESLAPLQSDWNQEE